MDRLSKLLYSACALSLVSCGGDGGADDSTGFRSVVQGGPQDIVEYRAIVAAGGVPALSVLEENGFFAEHKVDLPPADCGAAIPEARRAAIPGVRLCVRCQEAEDREAVHNAGYNRRGSKDSQLR